MTGPEAAKRLREMKCDLLIIGLTGNALPEDQRHFIEQGATLVLTKPVNVTELFDCIETHRGGSADMV
jgi:two-component system, sensor histidine kinase